MIQSISSSLLTLWGMCPEKANRRYLQGDKLPSGITAKIGTGVHKGAELNSRSKMITGKDEPLDVIQDAARDGYAEALREGVFFSPEEASGARLEMAAGVDKAVALARLYREILAPTIQPIAVEERLTATLGDIPLPIVGKLDFRTETTCPDIKTSSRKWAPARALRDTQPTIYGWLVFENTGFWPETSFEVLVGGNNFEHQHLPAPRCQQDMDALTWRIKIMLSMINAGLFPPAEPGHWCCSPKWCGYWWTCPHIPAHRKILPNRSTLQ